VPTNPIGVIEPMIAFAECSTQHRILVAGSKSVELMLELYRRGYRCAASSGNCGRPAGQYDVVLIPWRWRTLDALDATLDWLVNFLDSKGLLVVWVDAQRLAASQSLRTLLEAHGFVIEQGAVHEWGYAISARRSQPGPIRKAA
jgi:hypothetical protein